MSLTWNPELECNPTCQDWTACIERDRAVARRIDESYQNQFIDIKFSPGTVGLLYMPSDGKVVEVSEGGQAARAGVKVGWFLFRFDGVPYTHKLYEDLRNGALPYTVRFATKAVVAEEID